MTVNLERVHDLVPEAFQVNAQNLQTETKQCGNKNSQELFVGPTSNERERFDKIKNPTSGSRSTLQYLTPFLNLWKTTNHVNDCK